MPFAAIVLAGGAARRLGGVHKPGLVVAGVRLLDRVLEAVPDARPRVVVGPPQPVPPGVLVVREDPAGGGPAIATAAGIGAVPETVDEVAVLAGDLPFVTPDAVRALRLAAADPGVDGAVYVDGAGRRQMLCGVWRTAALRARAAATGMSMRAYLGGLRVAELAGDAVRPPWYDCDTEDDLRRAEDM